MLLVIGASGTLGRQVAMQAHRAGWRVTGTYFRATLPLPIEWRFLDVADGAGVQTLMAALRPAVVVHTAYQQRGPALWATTAEGAAHVAAAAQNVGARLVHISSDAFLDGLASPYNETARPNPVNLYAAAKAAAEIAVQASAPGAAIVRTSLIISRQPLDQHSRLVLDIAAGHSAARLFTDEYRCPAGVEDLAAAVLEVAQGDFKGIINLAGPEAVSRHQLGVLIARSQGIDPALLPAATVAESGLPRAADIRLDITLATRLLRTRVRGIHAYLQPGV